MNLVVNARDAMPDGGKLTITTSNVTLDGFPPAHPQAPLRATSDVERQRHGQRMTAGNQGTPFEALFTTKPAGKGTGLGLATCQTIVQQSSGFIEVESEVGKGATFKIYFPRVDKPAEAASEPARTAPLPRGTETVLLVEDEPAVKNLAANVLTALGYNVLRANNGQEALHLVHEIKGRRFVWWSPMSSCRGWAAK